TVTGFAPLSTGGISVFTCAGANTASPNIVVSTPSVPGCMVNKLHRVRVKDRCAGESAVRLFTASAGADAGRQRQNEYKGPLKGVASDFVRAYGVAVQLTGLTTRAPVCPRPAYFASSTTSIPFTKAMPLIGTKVRRILPCAVGRTPEKLRSRDRPS